MCGICGFVTDDFTRNPEFSVLTSMTEALRHRGPDQENYHLEKGVALGHQRLSVIDLASGEQPMANENGKLHVVFNGEIYNFEELRDELVKKGHPFKTKSDTEVLLHLYEEKGEGMVSELRGMFAFAIWDSEKKELFAARDRLGKKPLFYSEWKSQFFFASEIKAILQVPGFPREVEENSVSQFFSHTYIPYPATIFKSIFELPPAHTLKWKAGKVSVNRYWEPDFTNKVSLKLPEACERLWWLLTKATKMRLISDVPLGAFLSGGIDSSTVVALMAQVSGRQVKTFSIGFEDAEYNELPYAKQIAELIGTEHEEFIVKPNALEILPKLIWHYDQPFSDVSALPSFYVSKMTRSKVTVALNGDGGDENFCGYPRFQDLAQWRKIEKLPVPLRRLFAGKSGLGKDRAVTPSARAKRFLSSLPQSTLDRYLRLMIQFGPAERDHLFSAALKNRLSGDGPEAFIRGIHASAKAKDPLDAYLYVELMSYLPCDLLTKMDRASMAYGLETRSPFLDHTIVEFAASLPMEYKMQGKNQKLILKKMMEKKIPAEILKRPKTGFGVPIEKWFRADLREYVREVLFDPKTIARPYFNPDAVRGWVEEHQSGKANHAHRLWSLLVFELWHRSFIDRVPADSGD